MIRRSRYAQETIMTDTVLSNRHDVYGAITERIVRAIKEGAGTFEMPWHSSGVPLGVPTNAATGQPYRGVNILSLWADSLKRGFPTGYWASYKQWQSLGVQVRYREQGSLIIFYKQLDQTEAEREADEAPRYAGRASWIFNAAQVENWQPSEQEQASPVEIDKDVAAFVEATEAKVFHGYQLARYRRDLDYIEMPNPSLFRDTKTSTASQAYHSVLLHELTHYADTRIMPCRAVTASNSQDFPRGRSA
jgi:antirestriction protein ArdC